ncbi:MAG: tetratricopeptide repeat protein [Treponema sp.]|jgi:tetratricopeptide (TPR) repeat protein|nr:tetratricopeptide repeat protein [Treponema sp.]
MPSLQALKEFKASFSDIGHEKADRGEDFDDLSLPDTETVEPDADPGSADAGAAAGAFSVPDLAGDFDAGDLNFDDVDLETGAAGPGEDPGAGEGAAGGDLDFGAFLDTLPDDLSMPEAGFESLPDLAEPEAGFEAVPDLTEPEAGFEAVPDLTEPEAGFETVPDLTEPEAGFESVPDLTEPEAGFETESDLSETGAGIDLGGEAAFDLDGGTESTPGAGGEGDTGADDFGLPEGLLDDFDMDGETASAGMPESTGAEKAEDGGLPDFSFDEDLPAMDLGGELPEGPVNVITEDLESEPSPETETAGDFSIPDLEAGDEDAVPGEDLAGEAIFTDLAESPDQAEDMDFSVPGIEGLDLGGEGTAGQAGDTGGDTFDSFNPDGAGLGASAGTRTEDIEDMGDFSLPGIDDVFTGTSPGGAAAPGRGESFEASEDVEEIQLSDEDLVQLQKTISGYPLNLRIACEELIAEQVVAPDLMSALIKLLVKGASARETAALAGKILGRTITIPRGFEKKTGSELEAEQASFAYIFVHNFLPVLRLFLMIAIAVVSLGYLIYRFVYTPLRAESIYKRGYERLQAGEYERANERFDEAFRIHRVKNWFYRYAEGFRDMRQYLYAEEKYDALLRFYPRDKKGVLDYAALESWYLRNYAKAENLLRRNILDYHPDDRDGLMALGDNALAWGETDRSKYEDARFAYARLLDLYGWKDPVVERMLKYFIRTDNLKEVLPLKAWFMDYPRRKIAADTLAELGGYLLDKQLEEVRGVPNEYVPLIEGIREVLLKAVKTDPGLPESHYHLSRYYRSLGDDHEEKITLERAVAAFDGAAEAPLRRLDYRIRAQRRYGNILAGERRFIPAEEQIIKGIGVYEDALARGLLAPDGAYGRLYADLGDLEYFTQDDNTEAAIRHYLQAERNGWTSPEMQYRLGSAYYHQEEWAPAMERFFAASADLPLNRRLLYALGNTACLRGNYFAAQGYYNRLLDILEAQRARLPLLLPNDRPDYIEMAERLMIARNNMGVTLEALTEQTGDNRYRTRALAFYAESARAWDALTRNPDTMIRSGSVNLAFLNSRNSLYPETGYEPKLFMRIDKDVLEPSVWERLAPPASRLSGDEDAGTVTGGLD